MSNTTKKDGNLAEDVLRGAGKSEEEVRRTGQLDRGDELAEQLYDERGRTVNSPVHRAVWDGKTPVGMFSSVSTTDPSAPYWEKMDQAVSIVASHRDNGTLFGDDLKVTDQVINELGGVAYWGGLVDEEYGGWGAPLSAAMPFLTRMAAQGDPTVAGMFSIHGCIGAVDPISAFGTDEFKKEFLPKLSDGRRVSAFALTEPGAGSDLTALKTTAVLDGDDYVVNGQKLFISNVLPGRTIGLVVKIDDKPAVLIVDLPTEESENFYLDKYGIHAVKHIHNYGIVFKNFRVPARNLLKPDFGDGLTIAYHGLNRGRVALNANAAGTMRVLLKSMLPWGAFRETYGEQIDTRELVQARIAKIASYIVGADALTHWCSGLLDEGYRGELECIIAKIFGADALVDTTLMALKTHGGRSFLYGHLIGDNIHDFLAPSIYEGENEMLGMAEFKGLVKEHGNKFMAPFATVKNFNPMNPAHAWKLRGPLTKMAGWMAWATFNRSDNQALPGVDGRLTKHAKFALKRFRKLMSETHYTMLKHQLKLADRQQRMIQLSGDVQKNVIILATVMHASKLGDEATVRAADVLCRNLRRDITGGRPGDSDFRANVKLARLVVDGKFRQLDDVADTAILKHYEK